MPIALMNVSWNKSTITSVDIVERSEPIDIEPVIPEEPKSIKRLNQEPVPTMPVKEVFGLSQKAATATNDGSGVQIQQGNTLETARENTEGDINALPTPVEEYLVSQMPVLIQKLIIPYPPLAREKNIQGPVVMDLLIDATGAVAQVRFISGPGYGLDEAATSAIKNLKFKPALINGKPVAVRVRFTHTFVLEK